MNGPKLKILLLLFLVVFFSACGADNQNMLQVEALKYVSLPNYRNINIAEDFTEISESDVENIISWDLSSNDVYVEEPAKETSTDGDVLLLRVSSLSQELQFTETQYYEVGAEDIFTNPGLFIGCHKGDTFTTGATMINGIKVSCNVEILGIYRYPDINDTKCILSFYDCNSLDEVETYIRNRAREEIIFHFVWDYTR